MAFCSVSSPGVQVRIFAPLNIINGRPDSIRQHGPFPSSFTAFTTTLGKNALLHRIEVEWLCGSGSNHTSALQRAGAYAARRLAQCWSYCAPSRPKRDPCLQQAMPLLQKQGPSRHKNACAGSKGRDHACIPRTKLTESRALPVAGLASSCRTQQARRASRLILREVTRAC